jgi:hypothetical protein
MMVMTIVDLSMYLTHSLHLIGTITIKVTYSLLKLILHQIFMLLTLILLSPHYLENNRTHLQISYSNLQRQSLGNTYILIKLVCSFSFVSCIQGVMHTAIGEATYLIFGSNVSSPLKPSFISFLSFLSIPSCSTTQGYFIALRRGEIWEISLDRAYIHRNIWKHNNYHVIY